MRIVISVHAPHCMHTQVIHAHSTVTHKQYIHMHIGNAPHSSPISAMYAGRMHIYTQHTTHMHTQDALAHPHRYPCPWYGSSVCGAGARSRSCAHNLTSRRGPALVGAGGGAEGWGQGA